MIKKCMVLLLKKLQEAMADNCITLKTKVGGTGERIDQAISYNWDVNTVDVCTSNRSKDKLRVI